MNTCREFLPNSAVSVLFVYSIEQEKAAKFLSYGIWVMPLRTKRKQPC